MKLIRWYHTQSTAFHLYKLYCEHGRFFHSKGTWGCAASKGILFRTSSQKRYLIVDI